MKYSRLSSLIFVLVCAGLVRADDPTSKFVSLAPISTTLTPSSTAVAVQFEVWSQATGGTAPIFSEAHTVDTDSGSNITNDTGFADLLLGRPGGVVAANFPAGTSRYLDATLGGASVLMARVPLYAAAFTISAPNEIPGNLTLVNSTATAGNITKDGALFLHNFGTNNFFAGVNAGNLSTSGFGGNTGLGVNALQSNTTGTANTATGISALNNNTSGYWNTATGANALFSNTSGYQNTAIGTSALVNNTTGINNTASGFFALKSNIAGDSNTASGTSALGNNTSGSFNTANGESALLSNTIGGANTASGNSALENNTIGNYNTASGRFALFSNTSGSFNTASGSRALYYNIASNNTASGFEALKGNTTGTYNTAIGVQALAGNTTGSFNTAIGYGADVVPGSLTNATAIGYNAIVDGTNKIRLGDNNIVTIEGRVAYTFTSDKNQKENFQPVEGEQVLRKIRGLNLTSWNYIGHDPKQFRHYGPVAQEFFGAFGHDAIGTIGNSTTINSGDMEGILMVAVQALEKRTTELRQEEERLKAENAHLAEELGQQKERLTEAVEALKAQNAHLAARTEKLERLIRSYVLSAKAE